MEMLTTNPPAPESDTDLVLPNYKDPWPSDSMPDASTQMDTQMGDVTTGEALEQHKAHGHISPCMISSFLGHIPQLIH